MFRIIFDTSVSKFIVQLQCLMVMWNTCRDGKKDIQFDDYDQAKAWVRNVGLDKAYAEMRTEREYHAHVNPALGLRHD